MKELSLWQRVTWKIGYYKLLWDCSKQEKINKHLRKRFCWFGFHRLVPRSLETMEGRPCKKIITKKVSYLRCQVCNFKFFACVKDKEKYVKMSQPIKDSFSGIFGQVFNGTPKRRRVSGSLSSKNVSVRASDVSSKEKK